MSVYMSTQTLPLFPLNVVVFPQGVLPLHIFEARYLDMVKQCYRTGTPFGVVAVLEGAASSGLPFARIGTAVSIVEFDVPDIGLINIRCLGQQRFRINAASQQKDGLWVGQVDMMENDIAIALPDDLARTSENLRQVINALLKQGISEQALPVAKPYQFDDCAWVANRWCELLNLPLEEKQRLLELDSALLRLELIQDMFIANEGR
ncbi:hypothetical protein MTYP_00279 [Methylophilaceae bacterium]|nr:hypothetical protein MTYP_00279 [Methylophilaceae bacterium]